MGDRGISNMKKKPVIFKVSCEDPIVQEEMCLFLSKYASWLNFFFNVNVNHMYFEQIYNGFLWIFRDLENFSLLAKKTPGFIRDVLKNGHKWSSFYLEHGNEKSKLNRFPSRCKIDFKCIDYSLTTVESEILAYFQDIVGSEFEFKKIDKNSFTITFTTRSAFENYIGFSYSLLRLSVKEKYQLYKTLKKEKSLTH